MKTSRRRFYLPIGSKGCGIGPTGRDRAMPVTWRRRTAELRRRGRTTPHPNSGQRKGKFAVKFLPHQFKEEEWPIDAHCRKSARTVN